MRTRKQIVELAKHLKPSKHRVKRRFRDWNKQQTHDARLRKARKAQKARWYTKLKGEGDR